MVVNPYLYKGDDLRSSSRCRCRDLDYLKVCIAKGLLNLISPVNVITAYNRGLCRKFIFLSYLHVVVFE
jgi:hypothetical protein